MPSSGDSTSGFNLRNLRIGGSVSSRTRDQLEESIADATEFTSDTLTTSACTMSLFSKESPSSSLKTKRTSDSSCSPLDEKRSEEDKGEEDEGNYTAEDLFKLLQAQHDITKCFSNIALGMAEIIERKDRKKRSKRGLLKRGDSKSSFANTNEANVSSGSSVTSNSTANDHSQQRVSHVVESMALRQDELAVKVVGIAVSAVQKNEELEKERAALEDKVNQLQAYIESKRSRRRSRSSSHAKRSVSLPRKTKSFSSERPWNMDAEIEHSFSHSGVDAYEDDGPIDLPPGFSGVLEVTQTVIDVCEMSNADYNEGAGNCEMSLPEFHENESIRFVM